jgi:isochorismate synthase
MLAQVLIPRPALNEIADALRTGAPIASAPVDTDPLDLIRAGAAAFGTAIFFASPEGKSVGGLGIATQVTAAGGSRFERLIDGAGSLPPEATALTVFSFDPDGPIGEDWEGFPSALLVVPQITVVREAGRSRLTIAVPPGADPTSVLAAAASLRVPGSAEAPRGSVHTIESVPAVEDWRNSVADALGVIEGGDLQKVVLARTVRIGVGAPVGVFEVASLLRDRFPGCRVFGWQLGDAAVVGASPELLIAKDGNRFHTLGLAGSAPRSPVPEEDRRLGEGLLASAKNRDEHRIVVDEIVRRLESFAEMIDMPANPVVERFGNVQHLATPIAGRIPAAVSALDLAGALHPTPAVGGHPTPDALGLMSKLEMIDRGWYAGGIGWVDAAGNGELAVTLRCALVRGDTAVLFAGNGIVAGSDPDAEVAETRLKLSPLLDLLTEA